MAIKTVSQLDPFENGGAASGQTSIGQNLHFFDESMLTTNDKGLNKNTNVASFNASDYASGATTNSTSLIIANDKTYWKSLFELSQPTSKSKTTSQTFEYNSYSIKYDELMKNILWDVKAFLNFKNSLYDYNLSGIVNGDQSFTGTKKLLGNLSVSNNLSATNISASNLSAYNLTSTNAQITNLIATNLKATNENVDNLIASKLSVVTSLSIGNFQQVNLAQYSFYWGGYANGLKDNKDTFTKEGTWNGTITASRKDQPDRRGDPVCFKDGRPYELTCVNCAASAYSLINPDGSLVNVGKGEMRTVANVGGDTTPTNRYKAVYIENGIAKATNVIDFALHAYWSDLGERYLADAEYEPGTLVKFGGEKEITIADNEVNAIVSTNAFDLNACLVGGTVIALCGRVPTKVKGMIQKFDKIMLSDTPGIACKWDGVSRVIGRALENSNDEQVKLVECVVKMKL